MISKLTSEPWLAQPKKRAIPWIAGDEVARRRTRRMPPGGLKREDIDPSPDAVSGVGVPATMGIKVHIGSPAPLGHPSGNPLTGHRPLTPVAGEHPDIRFAAAQALKQKKRLGPDKDHASHAPLAQEIDLTTNLNRLNIPASEAAQFRNPSAEEVAALNHHEVPASRGTAIGSVSDGGQHHAEIVF